MIRLYDFMDVVKYNSKLKLKMASFSLASVLLLSGCGATSTNRTNYSDPSLPPVVSYSVPTLTKTVVDEETQAFFAQQLHFSPEEIALFQQNLKTIVIDYPFAEYYGSQDALKAYFNLSYHGSTEISFFHNNQLNAQEVYEVVRKNNAQYLADNPYLSKYSGTTDGLVQKVVMVMVEYINALLNSSAGTNIDLSSLNQKIQSLKIMESSTGSYAYYNYEDNIIGIDSQMIASVQSTLNDSQAEEKIIEHETNHFIQAHSPEELMTTGVKRLGPCYLFDQLEVNSIYWDWFFEGCAEQIVLDQNQENDSLTYQHEVDMLKTLKAATILSDKVGLTTLEDLSLQRDLDTIFTYFNCETDQEKEEIVNMMYAINLWMRDDSFSSSAAFYQIDVVSNAMFEDYRSKNDFQNYLKGAVGQTISKKFYSNLANSIVDKTVTLGEIFNLISIHENDLNHLVWYSDTSKKDALADFFEGYRAVQDTFLQMIADHLGVSLSEVQKAYYTYHAAMDEETISVSFLDSDKNVFFQQLNQERKQTNSKVSSIGEVYDSYLLQNAYQK